MIFKVLILFLHISYSFQCLTSSFSSTNVRLKIFGSNKFHELPIDFCINSTVLPTDVEFNEIIVTKQHVPDLNKGAVSDISREFKINFSGNNIEIIREGAFHTLPKLTEINLSKNQISWIAPGAFNNLPSLRRIVLMKNKVDLQPRCFNNLPLLTELDLRDNNLKQFNQEWFSGVPSLSWLWLRDNSLTSLSKATFINFPNLKQIHLENNNLQFIDKDAFKGLRNLQRIYFSTNKLKKFDVNFHTPSTIAYLGIQFNNITYLPDKLLNDLKSNLVKFWVTANPFQCECFNKLIQWAADNNIQLAWKCQLKDTVCIIPEKNDNQCIERSENELYEGYSDGFGDEFKCDPGNDY